MPYAPPDPKPAPKIPDSVKDFARQYGVPLIGAGLGYLSTRATNAAQVAEAEKNRQFQREMSDTSLQRSTRDAMAAGINPIFLAGRGASTPGGAQADIKDAGEGGARGVASALAVKQMRANIDLTESQAMKTRVEAADLQTQAASGRYGIISNQRDLGDLDVRQRQALFDTTVERARKELELTGANVESVKALTKLNQLASKGALNQAEFEQLMGRLSPSLRMIFEALRASPIKAR